MTLTREQIDALLEMLSLTKENELTCDECAKQVARFAEIHLENQSLPESLEAVQHHLDLCNECREEFEVLLRALQDK